MVISNKIHPIVYAHLYPKVVFFYRVDPDIMSVVYRAGIERGQSKEWVFLWNKFEKSTVASEKKRILNALGKTRDSVLIQRLIFSKLGTHYKQM